METDRKKHNSSIIQLFVAHYLTPVLYLKKCVILIVDDSNGTLLNDDLIGWVEDCCAPLRITSQGCVFVTAVCWSVYVQIPQDCGCVNELGLLMLTKLFETVDRGFR